MFKISKTQLFSLMVLFEIGSTTLFSLGIEAKQDAWISILIAMFIGFIILWLYLKLSRISPNENFAEIIIQLLGKFIGSPLVFLYGLFFLYASSRNTRDFSELIFITVLHQTPLKVINAIFVICIIFVLLLGLEVLGRTSEITFPIVIFFIFSIFILTAFSGVLHIDNLQPMFANDLKTILKPTFSTLTFFPFGEIVVFLMYWCYVDSKKSNNKISFMAILLSGLTLIFTTSLIISVLGVDLASNATIPLLEVIKLIDIGDIITNLDAIGIVIMFLGGFYKTAIFLFASMLTFATLFKIKKPNWLLIIIGIFLYWYSLSFESSYPYHIWLGQKVSLLYIYFPFEIIIPTILLFISLLKPTSKKTSSKGQ